MTQSFGTLSHHGELQDLDAHDSKRCIVRVTVNVPIHTSKSPCGLYGSPLIAMPTRIQWVGSSL